MAQLEVMVTSQDEEFRRQVLRLLRTGGVPVAMVADHRHGLAPPAPGIAIVDIRGEVASGMAAIERLRANQPAAAIFAVASSAEPDLILQAMRAGANEFLAWPSPTDDASALRSAEGAFQSAVERAAARRAVAQAGAYQPSVTLAFLGAKGGVGTTTVSVNCAVELARLTRRPTIIVDLKPTLGEVALFLGVRPRFTVLDALDNLHRLDRAFLRELVAKHKSGLDILPGSEQFDRPGDQDAGAVEELLRVLLRFYDFVVVDAGNWVGACVVAAVYASDTIFLVANPDVPCVRNAQRLVDRVRQLGAGGERVRILLNRVSGAHLIEPRQIESALGCSIHHMFSSDYRTVATALNAGVPLALANHSEIAEQFDRFTRRIIAPAEEPTSEPERQRGHFLGLF